MFSPWQAGIVVLIALVIFGPSRLPEIGKALGKGIREFKSSATGDEAKQAEQTMTNVTEQPKELLSKSDTTKQ